MLHRKSDTKVKIISQKILKRKILKRKMLKHNGSLSIETAVILPMFLVGLLTLASLGLMYEFRIRLRAAMLYCAESMSFELSDGSNAALSEVSAKVSEYAASGDESFGFVSGGFEGIDFTSSHLDETEYIEIEADYTLIPFSDMFGLLSIPVSDKCVIHNWCGYEKGYFPENYGEYVYVTRNSEVYHLNRQCSHIQLNIVETPGSQVGKLRNENGGKYYPCEYCKPKKSDEVLYVTSDGDRYHGTLSCTALKRTVYSISLSEAERKGLRPCTRCGR